VVVAHYAAEKGSLFNAFELSRTHCRYEEILPKVASIKNISIKMISSESVFFYPLGGSKTLAMLCSAAFILFEERDRKDERWTTNRKDERERERERERGGVW